MAEKKIERPEKGKGVGQWMGRGVLDVAGESYRFGDEIPKGVLTTAKLNAFKEKALIGKIVEPVAPDTVDEEKAKLERENAELKAQLSELKKDIEGEKAKLERENAELKKAEGGKK